MVTETIIIKITILIFKFGLTILNLIHAYYAQFLMYTFTTAVTVGAVTNVHPELYSCNFSRIIEYFHSKIIFAILFGGFQSKYQHWVA